MKCNTEEASDTELDLDYLDAKKTFSYLKLSWWMLLFKYYIPSFQFLLSWIIWYYVLLIIWYFQYDMIQYCIILYMYYVIVSYNLIQLLIVLYCIKWYTFLSVHLFTPMNPNINTCVCIYILFSLSSLHHF